MRTWADDFNTYTEACEYYGADTPASLAGEEAYYFEIETVEAQDDLEARGTPTFLKTYPDGTIPF